MNPPAHRCEPVLRCAWNSERKSFLRAFLDFHPMLLCERAPHFCNSGPRFISPIGGNRALTKTDRFGFARSFRGFWSTSAVESGTGKNRGAGNDLSGRAATPTADGPCEPFSFPVQVDATGGSIFFPPSFFVC
jgi:hypothetical protein